MKKHYLDNACTAFPKAPGVAEAVYECLQKGAVSINRSSYAMAADMEDVVFDTRTAVCRLFGGSDPRNVIFTSNITESLNIVLKGFLNPGDHVLVSSMEHNAVMRPLHDLLPAGVTFDRIPCNQEGDLKTELLSSLIRPETRAVIMTAASNVCGTVMPAAAVGAFCRAHGLRFILDTAQAAGALDLSMDALNADVLCFTGHKGLLGPQGTGGFLLRDGMAEQIRPFITGGTGSLSHVETMPEFLPDKFEAGTSNIPGIVGLYAGLRYVLEQTPAKILSHELALTDCFLRELRPLTDDGLLKIAGHSDIQDRVGVVSVYTDRMEMGELAMRLDEEYGIMVRGGLHCSPSAHKTLGTYPAGTIRFSFGYANTEEDAQAAADALRRLLREGAR